MSELQQTSKANWDDSHRQWALPNMPWNMKQTWSELLFAHYPVAYDVLRKLVPEQLPLDTYNGTCWVAVVPFQMSGVRLRGLPPIPGTDKFPELNVRTYVTVDGKPGVYFFSLDAANWLAVKGAKTLYHLPYWYSEMHIKATYKSIAFSSTRRSNKEIEFACSYHPISSPFQATKGSFEEWMVERYCFYTVNKSGAPLRCEILHVPWTLQKAEAQIQVNTILTKQGITVESDVPILHFAKSIEVRAWPLVDAYTGRLRL